MTGLGGDGQPAAFVGRVFDVDENPVGTCWVVAPGWVVTAWHVVADAVGEVPATGDGGSTVVVEALRQGVGGRVSARLVAGDPVLDVAVLAGDTWSCTPPELAAATLVAAATAVTAVGAGRVDDPQQPRPRRSWPIVGTWVGVSFFEDSVRQGVVAAPASMPGMSGAPVVGPDGRVVAMVSGRYNSADGWGRDTVWVTCAEDIAPVIASVAGAAVSPVGGLDLQEPADLWIRVDATHVSVRCPQVGVEATAAHGGVTPRLAAMMWETERGRARQAAVRHTATGPAVTFALGGVRAIGEVMTALFLPGPVGEAVETVFTQASRVTMPVRVNLRVEDPTLRRLPWEALLARGPDGITVPIALHPLATVLRRVTGAGGRRVPGPLTIVVAIAAPFTGGGAELDYESELRNVIRAVKSARAGNARVRVVPFATTAAILAELDTGDVHVLHVSGHGKPGHLELEDDNGAARFVTAREFVVEAIPPGKMPPVVSLAACHTNVTPHQADDAASPVAAFADGLIAAGVPVVVGTETSVTDVYATRVFAQLYQDLSRSVGADPVAAVSTARRAVQQWFAVSSNPREQAIAALDEWAVVTVRATDATVSLFPTGQPAVAPPDTTSAGSRAVGDLLTLDPGVFVGRRRAIHDLARALTEEQSPPMVVITGIGGIGKTTLAAEVVRRVCERHPSTVPATIAGPVWVETILARVTAVVRPLLRAAGVLDQFLPVLQVLDDGQAPWQERLAILQQYILDQVPVLLVLDNFEDNLADDHTLADPELARFLTAWAAAPGVSKMLVTSRYPVVLPDVDQVSHALGPLTLAETMKLVWTLPRLDALTDHQFQQVWAGVGGHPRTLETLDALLGHGTGRLPHIQRRLAGALTRLLGDQALADQWLARDRDLDAAIADAVTTAADDIVLPDLLDTLSADARRLLYAVAVHDREVDHNALLFAVGDPDPAGDNTRDREAARHRLERLLADLDLTPGPDGIDISGLAAADQTRLHEALAQTLPTPPMSTNLALPDLLAELVTSSLLTEITTPDGPRWFVHRWTATSLRRHRDDETADRIDHERAAHYRIWRVKVWPQATDTDVRDLVDARRHHLAIGDLDAANDDTETAATQMHDLGHWDAETALIADHLSYLPEDHPRFPAWVYQLGVLAQSRGDYDTAQARYEQSLTINERLGNQAGMAASYHQLGILAYLQGDYDTAQARYEQSLTIDERLGNQAGMAASYLQLGILAQARGDYDTAQARYEQSLTIIERLGNQAGMATGYLQLGILAQARGDYDTAQARYEQALTIRERLGNQAGMATSYHQLGALAQDRGDYDTAQARYEQSLTIIERLGNQAGMAASYHQLGTLAYLQGDYDTAQARYEQSLTINERLGNQAGMATSYHQLGTLAQARGDYDTAQARYEQSLTIDERLGDSGKVSAVRGLLNEVRLLRGDAEE
jgi:tetratricopeptide (TPR) repeat protein